MSKLKDYIDQDNYKRVAGNMSRTLDALHIQLKDDATTISTLQAKIKLDVALNKFNMQDLQDLINAKTRTAYGISKKNTYKTEFAKLKDKITDSEMQSDIQTDIDSI